MVAFQSRRFSADDGKAETPGVPEHMICISSVWRLHSKVSKSKEVWQIHWDEVPFRHTLGILTAGRRGKLAGFMCNWLAWGGILSVFHICHGC